MPSPQELADNAPCRQFDFSVPVAPTCHIVAFVQRWKLCEGGSVFQHFSSSSRISTIQRLYSMLRCFVPWDRNTDAAGPIHTRRQTMLPARSAKRVECVPWSSIDRRL